MPRLEGRVFAKRLVLGAASQWVDHGSASRAASLAFYSLLSLAPLLSLTIAAVGVFWQDAAVAGGISTQVRAFVGNTAGQAIDHLIEGAKDSNVFQSLVNAATALFASTGVFSELQTAMNRVWGVEAKPGSAVMTVVRDRFFSMLMVMGLALLLFVSLLANSLLSGIIGHLQDALGTVWLWSALNSIVVFLITAALFALIYRFVPDVQVGWRDVWLGSAVAALLTVAGKSALSAYVSSTSRLTVFGAAGSLVALILWVYYSSQILLLGAELTCRYAALVRHAVRPRQHSEWVGHDDWNVDPDRHGGT